MGQTSYLIALGGNRPSRHGSPAATLRAAIARLPGHVTAMSPIITTPPLGPSTRRFANAALLLDTNLSPPALLVELKAIERAFGRRAGRRWGARVLDLDIAMWSAGRWSSRTLTIPHQLFRKRRFVLDPALSVARNWRDPVTGRTIAQLHRRSLRAHPVDPNAPRP